jgi:hypothetical protein
MATEAFALLLALYIVGFGTACQEIKTPAQQLFDTVEGCPMANMCESTAMFTCI